ncbi:uncharacterized protein BJ212DRAFT_160616 [Suillus subaureus]|uniref:Uncharacterized protein n=1 Tax=Suillus subaureus TaxID=48587 RepID=A0A9P7EBW7_9AGAM|nr:uncharacterized protein BJ212DRAFT_160616 [Suillus subaureus]KAG1817279.1 hypothetical protein BJ212DRAFT_160616 [Suillus subaureus]
MGKFLYTSCTRSGDHSLICLGPQRLASRVECRVCSSFFTLLLPFGATVKQTTVLTKLHHIVNVKCRHCYRRIPTFIGVDYISSAFPQRKIHISERRSCIAQLRNTRAVFTGEGTCSQRKSLVCAGWITVLIKMLWRCSTPMMTPYPFGPCRILSDFGCCGGPPAVLVLLVRLRALFWYLRVTWCPTYDGALNLRWAHPSL